MVQPPGWRHRLPRETDPAQKAQFMKRSKPPSGAWPITNTPYQGPRARNVQSHGSRGPTSAPQFLTLESGVKIPNLAEFFY